MTTVDLAVLDNIEFDEQGFMADANAWNEDIAYALAADEGVTLTDRHWVVVNYARKEFAENGDAPTIRRITRFTDVNTKELYELFPNGPAKLAALIAGLPKPTGCI
jgi:tRNA 2-thiouridine synthesizing protein E